MSDNKGDKKKSVSRTAAAAPQSSGILKEEKETNPAMQEEVQPEMITDLAKDYEEFKGNVSFMFENIMGSLSVITSRLDSLENGKPSATPQEEGADPDVQAEDSDSSKPSSTNLAERMFERKSKTSEGRERRYSTLEDLVSKREDTRRRLHFDQDSDQEVASQTSRTPTDRLQESRPKKPGKIFRELKSSKEVSDTRPVMVMRKEKECHITIEKFQLSKVAKAIRDILDFQEEEETSVRIQKVLSRNLKEHLRLIYSITHADLARMDMADLFQIIARETRVYSTVAFYNELRDSLAHVKIMDWSKVSAVNHEVFYFQQLKLIDNFKRMLQIMLECNRKWCPRVDDKEYGLVRLFKSLNDPSYVRYAFGCMGRVQFDTMGEFFEEYSSTILDHYQVSLVVRELPYKANQEHRDRLKDYYERKRQISQNQKGSLHSTSKPHHISHLRQEVFNSDEEEYTCDTETEDKTDILQATEPIECPELGNEPEEGRNHDSYSEGDEPVKLTTESAQKEMEELNALIHQEQNSKSSTMKFGCMKKMLMGKCNKPNCPYSHNEATVLQSARDMREKLDAYIRTHSDAPRGRSQEPTLLRRDHFSDSRA